MPEVVVLLARVALCVLAVVLAAAGSALSQARQPFSEEAARQLIRAALLQYFDPASVFEITLSGATLSGDLLSIEDVLIVGKPVAMRGVRGEIVAQFVGLQVELAGLAGGQVKSARVGRATVVARSTARDAQEALVRISPSIMSPTVRFQMGQFEVLATIRRGTKLYPAEARGNFLVGGGQRVHVVITQAQVYGSDVPPNLIQSELAKINPVFDLSTWPVNLQIQRLVLHNDRIELLATGGGR